MVVKGILCWVRCNTLDNVKDNLQIIILMINETVSEISMFDTHVCISLKTILCIVKKENFSDKIINNGLLLFSFISLNDN